MSTLYIDTCANRFPGKDADARHCVRVSAINEGAPGLIDRVEFLIKPDGWEVADAMQPYLRATSGDLAGGISSRDGFNAIVPLLREATEIVAFNVPFHRKTIEALCRVNGCALTDFSIAPWTCVMSDAAPIMMLRLESAGRWRSPKMPAAYTYFTNKEWVEKYEWDEHAAQAVYAVRHIHHGILAAESKRRA